MSTQIRVQNQYVHIDDLGTKISNFNRPLVIDSNDVNFPFFFRGSACLLRLQSHFFAVTCFHNLNEITQPFDCIFLQAKLGGGHQFNIPLTRSFIPKLELRNLHDRFDVAIFEANLDSLPMRIDDEFFNVSEQLSCHVPETAAPILACGFPLCNATVDYRNGIIGRPATVVDGRFDKWSNASRLYCCRVLTNPEGGVSDGFSGGGAFGLRIGSKDVELCFSGIVIRGNEHFFYAIDPHFIRNILLNALDST